MPPALAGSRAVSPQGSWTGSGSARRACRRNQGEQVAGGGDLGDVLSLGPAAGDDALLERTSDRVRGDVLDGLDQRPAQQPGALLGDAPAADLGVGYL